MTQKKRRNVKRTKGQGSVFTKPGTPFYHLSYLNGWRQVRESSRTSDHKEAWQVFNESFQMSLLASLPALNESAFRRYWSS